MPVCWVPDCSNRTGAPHRVKLKDPSGQPVQAVRFHRFPRDPELLQKWLKNIGRDDSLPSDSSKICSVHFLASCFERNYFAEWRQSENAKSKRCWNLMKDAVPTEFKGRTMQGQVQDDGVLNSLKRKAALGEDGDLDNPAESGGQPFQTAAVHSISGKSNPKVRKRAPGAPSLDPAAASTFAVTPDLHGAKLSGSPPSSSLYPVSLTQNVKDEPDQIYFPQNRSVAPVKPEPETVGYPVDCNDTTNVNVGQVPFNSLPPDNSSACSDKTLRNMLNVGAANGARLQVDSGQLVKAELPPQTVNETVPCSKATGAVCNKSTQATGGELSQAVSGITPVQVLVPISLPVINCASDKGPTIESSADYQREMNKYKTIIPKPVQPLQDPATAPEHGDLGEPEKGACQTTAESNGTQTDIFPTGNLSKQNSSEQAQPHPEDPNAVEKSSTDSDFQQEPEVVDLEEQPEAPAAHDATTAEPESAQSETEEKIEEPYERPVLTFDDILYAFGCDHNYSCAARWARLLIKAAKSLKSEKMINILSEIVDRLESLLDSKADDVFCTLEGLLSTVHQQRMQLHYLMGVVTNLENENSRMKAEISRFTKFKEQIDREWHGDNLSGNGTFSTRISTLKPRRCPRPDRRRLLKELSKVNLNVELIKQDSELCKRYTGFPSYYFFQAVFNTLKAEVATKSCCPSETGIVSADSDHFEAVLTSGNTQSTVCPEERDVDLTGEGTSCKQAETDTSRCRGGCAVQETSSTSIQTETTSDSGQIDTDGGVMADSHSSVRHKAPSPVVAETPAAVESDIPGLPGVEKSEVQNKKASHPQNEKWSILPGDSPFPVDLIPSSAFAQGETALAERLTVIQTEAESRMDSESSFTAKDVHSEITGHIETDKPCSLPVNDGPSCDLSLENEFLASLIRIKTDIPMLDLAQKFNVAASGMDTLTIKWAHYLLNTLSDFQDVPEFGFTIQLRTLVKRFLFRRLRRHLETPSCQSSEQLEDSATLEELGEYTISANW